ncbi:hypothetical protein Hanom_Chr03g00207771 [Helianthus anomalus]
MRSRFCFLTLKKSSFTVSYLFIKAVLCSSDSRYPSWISSRRVKITAFSINTRCFSSSSFSNDRFKSFMFSMISSTDILPVSNP